MQRRGRGYFWISGSHDEMGDGAVMEQKVMCGEEGASGVGAMVLQSLGGMGWRAQCCQSQSREWPPGADTVGLENISLGVGLALGEL